MRKIVESVDTVYIYITGFNFINYLYRHKTIFTYVFLHCQKCISENSLFVI